LDTAVAKTKEEIRDYFREYRKKNKAKLRAKRLEWEAANVESKREYDKEHNASRKEQIAEYNKQYREDNRELLLAKNKEKWKKNGDKYKAKNKLYREANKEMLAKRCKDRREANPEKVKEYYQKNRGRLVKVCVQYRKNRLIKDPLFAFKERVRGLMKQVFKRTGYKKSCRTYQILGCSYEEFLQSMRDKFLEVYSKELPDNLQGLEIHHIIPICNAKTEEDITKLNHHSNLVVLTKEDHKHIHNKGGIRCPLLA
jgi:hypothetical protein